MTDGENMSSRLSPRSNRPGVAKRIGLLGGSFNPAHAGHLHLSEEALKRLPIDEIWWLVSPLNPLKEAAEAAPYDQRLQKARALAIGHQIYVSDFERGHGTRFTFDTLAELRHAYPNTRFLWLMGADGLVDFHRWKRWRDIPHMLPIAIFDRPGYSLNALSSRFAAYFRRQRLSNRKARQIWEVGLPAWIFIPCPRHAESSTRIRARAKSNRRSQ